MKLVGGMGRRKERWEGKKTKTPRKLWGWGGLLLGDVVGQEVRNKEGDPGERNLICDGSDGVRVF